MGSLVCVICIVCAEAADSNRPPEEHCNSDSTQCDCQHRPVGDRIPKGS